MSSKYQFETKCVRGAYTAKKGEPHVLPIVQSATYRYESTQDVADLFDLKSDLHMYSRISNPTCEGLEKKFALLEGGSFAVAVSSGQAASLLAVLNVAEAGDSILATRNLYGGTTNLLAVSLKKMGIETIFVDQDLPKDEIIKMAKNNCKAVFGETLANPVLSVLDFDKFSAISKELGVPFIVDNTLATPYFCRPIEHGANVVIHSTTKYADGHATTIGGIIIDGGNFDWSQNDKFKGFTEPDESYHGIVFYEAFKNVAYGLKIRAQLLRDLGTTMAPMTAFLTNVGLETLPLRMERHAENALKLATFLQNHPSVDWISYPGLKENPYHELQQKYMPKGASGILVFGIKGGKEAGMKFIEALEMTDLVVHVGDIRTIVLHPSSTTHRQLSEEEQKKAGIKPELIRVSVGIEHIDDIIADFNGALKKATL